MSRKAGPRSQLIRDAIKKNPGIDSNKELAQKLNDDPARKQDNIKVTAEQVAGQRQAMKKGKKSKRGRTSSSEKAPAQGSPAPVATAAPSSTLDVVKAVGGLAKQVGGIDKLKQLVEEIAAAGGK